MLLVLNVLFYDQVLFQWNIYGDTHVLLLLRDQPLTVHTLLTDLDVAVRF